MILMLLAPALLLSQAASPAAKPAARPTAAPAAGPAAAGRADDATRLQRCIATIATAAALVLAYPAALFIARASSRWRVPLLVLVILPFWTSFLIRTYAWMVLLNPAGLINKVLLGIGVIDEPLPLLYNEFAVTLGLVYAYLPLMVLPLVNTLSRMPRDVEAAADSLGASPVRVWLRVMTPAWRRQYPMTVGSACQTMAMRERPAPRAAS